MPPPGAILLLDDLPLPVRWEARRTDRHLLPTALPRDAVARIRRAAGLLGTRDVRFATGTALRSDSSQLLRQLPRVGLTVLPDTGETTHLLPEGIRLVLVTDVGAHELGTSGDPRVLVLERGPAAGPLAGLARELGWQPM